MKFYELQPITEASIKNTEIRPFVRILFELESDDVFIPDSDILECVTFSYKIDDGGIINGAELLLDNTNGTYDIENNVELLPGMGVQIWYCFGERENTFFRFHLFVDDNGFQTQETGYLNKTCKVRLIDLSSKLDNTKLQRNWTDAQTVIHSTVCDKDHPENSLVHIIAARGGIGSREVNCGNLPFDIPYVVVAGSAWKELCAPRRPQRRVHPDNKRHSQERHAQRRRAPAPGLYAQHVRRLDLQREEPGELFQSNEEHDHGETFGAEGCGIFDHGECQGRPRTVHRSRLGHLRDTARH